MNVLPVAFLITGFLWLLGASALGIWLYVGIVVGNPLPASFRLVHAHGALLGGALQVFVGSLLHRNHFDSHPWLFLTLNAGTIALLAGPFANQPLIGGVAGVLILVAALFTLGETLRQIRSSIVPAPLSRWYYGFALALLFGGLAVGAGMQFGWIPYPYGGQARLLHLHLPLTGFMTLTVLGYVQEWAPALNPTLTRLSFVLVPASMTLLLGGFVATHLWVQIAGGLVLLAGTGLAAYNLARAWGTAGRPRAAMTDHTLLAVVFLLFGECTGILVSVNAFWQPPFMPFGTLHLVGYTHVMLVGFILQFGIAVLSDRLPTSLAVLRVKSNKKRAPYLTALQAVVDRWRPLQVWTLSLGTIGLPLTAALVWQFNLSEPPVLAAAGASAGLIGASLALVAVKFIRLWFTYPAAEE
jgi:hypothetical protein